MQSVHLIVTCVDTPCRSAQQALEAAGPQTFSYAQYQMLCMLLLRTGMRLVAG